MHLVGFIIRIYHDSRSPESQFFLITNIIYIERDRMRQHMLVNLSMQLLVVFIQCGLSLTSCVTACD